MANIAGGVAGGVGGFAAAGPVGGIAGALAGLFGGGDSRQEIEAIIRDWTPEERAAVNAIMQQYPGAIEAMSPEARTQVFGNMRKMLRDQGARQVMETFRRAEEAQNLGYARTGGQLGSISLYNKGELARQRGQALSENETRATLGAEQIAGNRMNEAFQRVGILGQSYIGLDQNRRIGQTIFQENPNPAGPGLSMLGYGLMAEDSYLSQNKDKLWGDIKGLFGGTNT